MVENRNIYFNSGNSSVIYNSTINSNSSSSIEEDFSVDENSSNKRLKTVRAFEPSSLPDLSVQSFQERAYTRMCVRFETLRWKYQWEIVSNHAAIRAQEIYNYSG